MVAGRMKEGPEPHHLVGTVSISDEMSAAKFRERALVAISEIHSRGKLAIVVGGSGLYVKALTHGLSSAPASDADLRAGLNEFRRQAVLVCDGIHDRAPCRGYCTVNPLALAKAPQ